MSVAKLPHCPVGGLTALACRVIPCLDVADGEVVKGVRFEDLESFGSPAAAQVRRPGVALQGSCSGRVTNGLRVELLKE